ncbi:MAG TPA: hypothetical protein VJ577_18090 [Burkholderiaceae bacterium]|nr:hypothetical protein [Burkholderiaceae bacterium]
MGIDSADKRRERAELQKVARPQSGVDDLKGKFGRPTKDLPGVVDKKNAGRQAERRPAWRQGG